MSRRRTTGSTLAGLVTSTNFQWGRCRLGLTTSMLGALAVFAGCRQEITRISDGSTRLERPISAEAYAAFGRARLLELQGDTRAAVEAYLEVIDHDPEAAEAYVRIGALRCPTDSGAAARAFSEAERRSPGSAELQRAMARCALLHHRPRDATAAAAKALQLAPDRESSLLLIEAHRAADQADEAKRHAWAHVVMFPDHHRGWTTLAELVGPSSPLGAQLMHRAAEHLPTGFGYVEPTSETRVSRFDTRPAATLDLEVAFASGDARSIHRAARVLGLSTIELIERAMAAGAFEFARGQATIAGQISPDDVMLWQVRLRLADLLGDDAEFEALLNRAPTVTTSQPDLGLLFRVIQNRTGFPPITSSAVPAKADPSGANTQSSRH